MPVRVCCHRLPPPLRLCTCSPQFGFYELARTVVSRIRRPDAAQRTHGEVGPNGLECAACGAISALCASVLTTPLDVARTRVMTQAAGSVAAYRGVIDCLGQLLRTEGAGALFSGLGERAVMSSFGGAIWFSVYESIRSGPPE
jgi:hypothetical protein